MSSVLFELPGLRRMGALVVAGLLSLPALGCSTGGSEPDVKVSVKAPQAARAKKGKKKAPPPKKGVVVPITARDGEFDYAAWAQLERPLAMPEAAQKGPKALVQTWQKKQRTELKQRVLFPYTGTVEVKAEGKARSIDKHQREEFLVTLDGKLAFRYFRLTPKSKALGQTSVKKPAAPADASGKGDKPVKLPTVLAFMSHGKVLDLLENEASDDRGAASELADAGYLVFAMENAAMAAKDAPGTHRALDDALRLNGSSWYGLVLTHAGLLLDQVAKDPEVDTKRIGAMGASTGGMLALTLAAMDPRVTAVSSQGVSGSWHSVYAHDYRAAKNPNVPRHHCRCGLSTRLLPDFDVPELSAMVAPRPLHLTRDEGEAAGSPADRVLSKLTPVFDKFGVKPTVDVVPKSRYLLAEHAEKFFRASFGLSEPEGSSKGESPSDDSKVEPAEAAKTPAVKAPAPPAGKASAPPPAGDLR